MCKIIKKWVRCHNIVENIIYLMNVWLVILIQAKVYVNLFPLLVGLKEWCKRSTCHFHNQTISIIVWHHNNAIVWYAMTTYFNMMRHFNQMHSIGVAVYWGGKYEICGNFLYINLVGWSKWPVGSSLLIFISFGRKKC